MPMHRRDALHRLAVGAGRGARRGGWPGSRRRARRLGRTAPVVETSAGKVRGYRRRRRVRRSRACATAPTPPRDDSCRRCRWRRGPASSTPWTSAPWRRNPACAGVPMGEDCLHLNLWTPATGAGRRPVMVWFHPGAFSSGTSNELEADGARLARRGDVVVVTVNHRLNVFGHLYLAEIIGPRVRRLGQRRHARPRARPAVGARQHRRVRRRPGQRDHLRAVGRRRQVRHPDGDAAGARAVPPRHHDERPADHRQPRRHGHHGTRSSCSTPWPCRDRGRGSWARCRWPGSSR